MNPKQKVKLASIKLPAEIQSEVDELQKTFVLTQEHLEEVEKSGKVYGKSVTYSVEARKSGNALFTKKGHDVDTHREILKKYTQSISFAPKGTEELVLGYSNRSVFLMHIRCYKESLVDIDRALELTKDDLFKKKLQARKEKCLGLLNEQELIKLTKNLNSAEKTELEKIRSKFYKFQPSATIPCAADCIAVGYNDLVGRHLIATRDIQPGEIVIAEEGYACIPHLDRLHLVCSHCLQYAFNGIPCDNCFFAIYCSEDCKNEAFNEYHDIECPIMKYMWTSVYFNEKQGSDRIGSLRILIKAMRNEGFENVMKEISARKSAESFDVLLTDGILKNNFKACYNLLPFAKEVETGHKKWEFNTCQILYLLVEHTDFLAAFVGKNSFAEESTMNSMQPVFYDNGSVIVDPRFLLILKEALMKLKSITATNQYLFISGTWQCGYCNNLEEHRKICKYPKGTAIVPCCSLLNHSCTPNVRHVCTPKRKIIVYSICPIKKGEMLCSSYKSTTIFVGDVNVRRNQLKKFVCKCKACLDNIDPSMFMDDYIKDVGKIVAELKKKISPSMAKSYIQTPVDDYKISGEVFQTMMKVSQLVHKNFNYYKAFAHNATAHAYFEKTIAKLHQDKIFMPNDC